MNLSLRPTIESIHSKPVSSSPTVKRVSRSSSSRSSPRAWKRRPPTQRRSGDR